MRLTPKGWLVMDRLTVELDGEFEKGDRKGGRVAHRALVRVQTRNDDEA